LGCSGYVKQFVCSSPWGEAWKTPSPAYPFTTSYTIFRPDTSWVWGGNNSKYPSTGIQLRGILAFGHERGQILVNVFHRESFELSNTEIDPVVLHVDAVLGKKPWY